MDGSRLVRTGTDIVAWLFGFLGFGPGCYSVLGIQPRAQIDQLASPTAEGEESCFFGWPSTRRLEGLVADRTSVFHA